MSSIHRPHFGCPESPEHAAAHAAESTPLYDRAAFAAGFAPVPTVAEVRAEYERQVAAGHARGDGVTR